MTICHLNLINNTGLILSLENHMGKAEWKPKPPYGIKKDESSPTINISNDGNLNFMVVYNALDLPRGNQQFLIRVVTDEVINMFIRAPRGYRIAYEIVGDLPEITINAVFELA